jgi:F0F1-type ATP synthase beta subunit
LPNWSAEKRVAGYAVVGGVPADDLADPAVVATFAHLDAATILSHR